MKHKQNQSVNQSTRRQFCTQYTEMLVKADCQENNNTIRECYTWLLRFEQIRFPLIELNCLFFEIALNRFSFFLNDFSSKIYIWHTFTHSQLDTIFNIQLNSILLQFSINRITKETMVIVVHLGFFNYFLFFFHKKKKIQNEKWPAAVEMLLLFLSYLFRNVELCNAETTLNRNCLKHEYFEYFNWSSIEWLLRFYSLVICSLSFPLSFFLKFFKWDNWQCCGKLYLTLSPSFKFSFFFGSFHLFDFVCCVLFPHSISKPMYVHHIYILWIV